MRPYGSEASYNIGSKRHSAARYSDKSSEEDLKWLDEKIVIISVEFNKLVMSDSEALTTAALTLGVGVVKHELTADLILYKVHLSPNQEHQRPRINDYSYIFFSNNFI